MANHEMKQQRGPRTMYYHGSKRDGGIERESMAARRIPSSIRECLLLFMGAILVAPMNTILSWNAGVGTGVLAALCDSEVVASTKSGDVVAAQQVNITSATGLNLSMFDCEEGAFDVFWNGHVSVTGTILIGRGTTVRIYGNATFSEADCTANKDGNDASETYCGLTYMIPDGLTSGLALPRGLTSAAVGVAPSTITTDPDPSISFGPMFHVDNGTLILEDFIVRGGFAANSDKQSGAGVYAVDSIVSIFRCHFDDHFATISGGGIFAEESALVVANSTFSDCRAGFPAIARDDNAEGTGGGIHVSTGMNDLCLHLESAMYLSFLVWYT